MSSPTIIEWGYFGMGLIVGIIASVISFIIGLIWNLKGGGRR